MSLSSWKKEFYNKPANKVSKRFSLQHSTKKWTGLTLSNIKKHNLTLLSGTLVDVAGNEFEIDGSSCALCEHFYRYDACNGCPLDNVGCCCLRTKSPWAKFVDSGRASCMINALKRAAVSVVKKQRSLK